ncbi:MAG: carboxypeptidase regulatory-like domain-containing protein [Acidobacteriota bacterium]|nr:carboxypeptidase regulatory-like domain-containing protein [Acidobacteriota bacterium]
MRNRIMRRRVITLALVSLAVLLSLEYWKRQEKTTTSSEQARTTFAEPVSGPNESPRKTVQAAPGGFRRNRLSEAKRKNTAESTRVEILILDEDSRSPIPAATLTVLNLQTRTVESSHASDGSGRVLLNLEFGEYRVTARHPEYAKAGGSPRFRADSLTPTIRRTIALPPKTHATGIVRNQYGQGVEEASVLFKHMTRGKAEGTLFRTKTRQGGWFEVGIPRGTYKVHVSKLLHKPILEEGILIPGTEPIQIILAEETGLVRLSGEVVDGSGQPVTSAMLIVKPRAMPRRGTSTDANGYFEMMIPTGKARMFVNASGYSSHQEQLRLTGDITRNITLSKREIFTVRVYDPSGRPVKDAGVEGRSLEDDGLVLHESPGDDLKASGEDKQYYATTYPVRIFASAVHLGFGFSEAVVMQEYQPYIELHLSGRGELLGRVVDQKGRPVQDFSISLNDKETGRGGSSKILSEHGQFAFRHIPAGTYSLTVAGYGDSSFHRVFPDVAIRDDIPTVLELVLSER